VLSLIAIILSREKDREHAHFATFVGLSSPDTASSSRSAECATHAAGAKPCCPNDCGSAEQRA
jgi:hypothetical protein